MGTLAEYLKEAPNKGLPTEEQVAPTVSPTPLPIKPIQGKTLAEKFGPAPVKQEVKANTLQDKYGDFIPKGVETKESVLASPKDMAAIRKMMVASKDTYYQTASDDETYDAFMSHMRWLNSNETYTAKEAIDVYAADNETRVAYGEAYKVYDRVSSIFTNGGDLGDKAGAIKDYGQAILTSPSTYAGFIVGKMVGRAGSKVAIKGIQELTIAAAETAAKEIAKKGGTKALQETAKREVVNAAVKVSTKRAVIAAAGVEGLLANFQDQLYQDVMMDTGAQEEYSYMQNAISTVLGGSGAVTSMLGHKTFKGATGLSDAGKKIEAGKVERAKGATKRVVADLRKSIKKVNTDWAKLVKDGRGLDDNQPLRDAVVKWFTDYKTEDGFAAILQKNGVAIKGTDDKTFSKSLTDFAMGLDAEARDEINEVFEPLGITFGQVVTKFAAIVNEAGYQNQSVSSMAKFFKNYQNVTIANRSAAQGVAEAIANPPRPVRPTMGTPPVAPGFTRLWRGVDGKDNGHISGSSMTGGWFTTKREKAEKYAAGGGRLTYLDLPEKDKSVWIKFSNGHGGPDEWVTDNAAIQKQAKPYEEGWVPTELEGTPNIRPDLDDADEVVEKVDKETLGYLMSTWKRLVVSHPATTVANVKGFGIAMAARTASEAVQMSALYGAAGVKALMGSSTAGKTLGQANALFKNMSYMTRMAVDPFTTVEAFHAMLEQAPKKHQKRVAKQFFQGVDNKGAASFGLNPEGFAVKNTEKLIKWAQDLSFVNAQDVMTKSFSGMKELDKQTRLKFGVGIDDILNTGRSHEITDDMWSHAIKALEEDTFSKDFRGTKGWFGMGRLADISQQISSIPGIGFFYPFGQFVNSVIDFGIRYSPLALAGIASKVMKKQIDVDLGEKISQMIVGTTMIGTLAHREAGKEKDGLQWNEERDASGGVYKVDNLFPWGLYNLAGRIALGWDRGEGVNKDLMTAAAQQLSFPAALGDIGSPQVIRDMVDYATSPTTTDDDKNAFWDLMGYSANFIAPIAAGFTRPLDPLNKFVGAYSDANGITSNVTIDKKLSPGIDGTIQSFSRYTNTLFNYLLGEPDEEGKLLYGKPKHSATQKGEIRSGNDGAGIFGAQYAQRRTPIDKLLGMVNKAPFKADSFTSGDPEYDDWMNQNVNPILEREATRLLNNDMFKGMTMAAKIAAVDDMLTAARNEVLATLETNGSKDNILLNERRKLLVLPKNDRNAAKEELGITTPDHKLNMTQIRIIQTKIKMNEKMRTKGLGF